MTVGLFFRVKLRLQRKAGLIINMINLRLIRKLFSLIGLIFYFC